MKEVKKSVKRLKSKKTVIEEEGKTLVKNHVTEITVSESELGDLVPKKMFLFRPRIVSTRFCYVPCRKVVLQYSVSYFSARRTDKGRLTFIVDDKKGTGVIEDNIKLKIIRKSIEGDLIEEEFFSDEQAVKKAVVYARWKVLLSKYKKPPELEVISSEKFYRPYYEVLYSFGGKEKKAWIPADRYGTYFVYN